MASRKAMATEALLGSLDDSDRVGLETLLPRSPSPGRDNYRCPASTPSHHFRRDLSAQLRPQEPRGGGDFEFVSPSPVLNRRTAGRFSGSSVRRTFRSQEGVALEGSGLRRKMVDYYYVDKSWQRRQAAQTNTTWLRSLCSQPVDEILRKYRRKSELQKSKMLWSKTYSTPGERALLHAWESNVVKGDGGSFPGPLVGTLQQRGLGMTAVPESRPEKLKGSSLSQSHAHARATQQAGMPGPSSHSYNLHNASRSEPSVKSSHYARDAESLVSLAEDHSLPPPPPSSAVWAHNGPAHSRGHDGNGQVFFRLSTNQQPGGRSSLRLPALSSKEKVYMFRQRKYIANGGRGHYPATLGSGGDAGQDSAAATITARSEELSQIFSVEPSPRIETPTPEKDVPLPRIQGKP